MADREARNVPVQAESGRVLDLLEWTETNRVIAGRPMRIPGPLRDIYRDLSKVKVVMKGAQIGISEYVINDCMWTADVGYAGRGTALYVQPTGNSAGDFVQGRVRPAIDDSAYLTGRMGKAVSGRTSDPDKVGLMKVGLGHVYWRTARSKTGLKSVPTDLVALDEYDEMPTGTLALASHRLDSSNAPRTVIVSTPTYPGAGIDPEYRAGDQMRYFIPCLRCGTFQVLEWEKNVRKGVRVCVKCRGSLEAVIGRAWDREGVGRWRPTNPDGVHRSYHLSQLYRPQTDLTAIATALDSSDATVVQEAWNQFLGIPFAPAGGQLSLEELQRVATAPFTMAQISGVQGCLMGIDPGARLHCWLLWPSDRWTDHTQLYTVGAFEVDNFAAASELMERFGVEVCVVDAHPEYHAARDFQAQHPGVVYLANYVPDRMPPQVVGGAVDDPKARYRVTVDRTAAMDAVAADIRKAAVLLPRDAESVPGLFAHLQAPVRRIVTSPSGKQRAVFEEGARPDHYYHALVYAELAVMVAQMMSQRSY